MTTVRMTLIGGPTALIEIGGFRLLTDPTFDPPGAYRLPHVTLEKTQGPALALDQLGPVDAVLLSHDQHADNLDTSGRDFLRGVPRVLTTSSGAVRLGGHVEGLAPWAEAELAASDGRRLRIVATPARHGPPGIEPLAGDVVGFVVETGDSAARRLYFSGDTVWYHGVAEVARQFAPGLVVPCAGAARTRGPFHLTMNTNDVLETASVFADARIVPVHYAGWKHFTQSGDDLRVSFDALGVGARLTLLAPGVPTELTLPEAAG